MHAGSAAYIFACVYSTPSSMVSSWVRGGRTGGQGWVHHGRIGGSPWGFWVGACEVHGAGGGKTGVL